MNREINLNMCLGGSMSTDICVSNSTNVSIDTGMYVCALVCVKV